MTDKTIELSAMPTPNPNTIKFLPNKDFFEAGSVDFPNKEKAEGSILPETLFQIDGIEGVMVGHNFVSVTKTSDTTWETVLEVIRNTIIETLSAESDVIKPELVEEAQQSVEHDDEISQKIQQILDEEIRPAIAMDGGDVSLRSYEDGIVRLYLQGACSTCPSATMTLKMGIENRLKEDIPEIVEVVQEI